MTLLAIGEGDEPSDLINHAQNADPRTQFTGSGSERLLGRSVLKHPRRSPIER